MNYQVLSNLLIDQGIGSEVPAADAAEQLNTASVTFSRKLTGQDLLFWSVLNTDSYAALKADPSPLAEVALRLLSSPAYTMDLETPEVQGFLGAVTSITAAGKAMLYAMAEQTISPAQKAGLGKITARHVERARLQP